jgi:phage baseplate assembly protein W|tara:strand:+ start:135 stop:518 length:384 start_codon:yes stop_codon:yes gene_type:complete
MSEIFGYTTINEPYTSNNLSGLNLAKQDLLNHFKIRKGEKWTDPSFGCNLELYIFQPLDKETKDSIDEEVYNVINYDPRFEVNDSNIRVVEDDHSVTVNVKLTYLPTTTATELQIKFDREFSQNAEF